MRPRRGAARRVRQVGVDEGGRRRTRRGAADGRGGRPRPGTAAPGPEDAPSKRIAWQSLPDSPISNSGSVEFTPADNGDGTEVRVTIGYGLPGGALGKAVATLFGESPDQQVNDDLRRFKQILETGQVLRSDGSPEGTAAARQMHQHPAQPATREGAT